MSWRELVVISWTGMRGVVTLAAAVSVVASSVHIPAQDTIFLIAFVVTVGTLLLQGLTLPWVIRTLKVRDDREAEQDISDELALRQRTTAAALQLLDERQAVWVEQFGREAAETAVNRLRVRLERQTESFRQDSEEEEQELGAPTRPDRLSIGQMQSIRRELLERRREVVLAERENGNVDEQVLRRVLVSLDAEELGMDSTQVASSRS